MTSRRSRLHIDFETRSPLNIKEVGGWRYARHPQTEIICLAYALDGEEPICLTAKQLQNRAFIPVLQRWFLAPGEAGYLTAHQAHFEYAIWDYIMYERYGYPRLEDPRMWDCTMARALACGLPAKLEKLGAALDTAVQKDMGGRAAMLKISRPLDFDALGDPIYREEKDFPELFQSTYSYCCDDVRVETGADIRLPELSEAERKVWELDLTINRRGIRLDVAAAAQGAMLADAMIGPLNQRLSDITEGKVKKATQVQVLKNYLEECGVIIGDSLDKQAVAELLKDKSLSPVAREVLIIRQQVSKTSTKKFESMLAVADPFDQRARGLLQYSGAATGRWAGRLLQPHNFPRVPKGMKMKEKEQAEAVAAMLAGDPYLFLLQFGSQAMDTLSAVLRGMIISSEGKQLSVADFSAIEARVLLWLSGDENALNMLRSGQSLYIDMAEFIFKRTGITKDDEMEYQLGKKIILGAGYGMGHIKFVASCLQDDLVVIEDMAKLAIKAYREKYKSVVSTWYATERAAVRAIQEPGSIHKCCGDRIAYGMDRKREFLVCRLPSGRFLRYFRPTASMVETPWGTEKMEIRYWTTDLKGGLSQFKTYGGSLVENNTQAVARDLMASGMLKSEAAGYHNVLTVHDEIIGEAPDADFASGAKSLKKFIEIMCDIPDWAKGCPVTAEGFISKRYRKQ